MRLAAAAAADTPCSQPGLQGVVAPNHTKVEWVIQISKPHHIHRLHTSMHSPGQALAHRD